MVVPGRGARAGWRGGGGVVVGTVVRGEGRNAGLHASMP